MSTTPRLCDRCIACIELVDDKETGGQRFLLPEDDFIHQPNLDSFLESVQKSCIICSYLHTCWSPLPKRKSFSTDLRWISPVPGAIGLRIRLNWGDALTISLKIVDDLQALSKYHEPIIPGDTADERVLHKIRSWMQTCTENHPACEAHRSAQTYYPSRLLELSPLGQPAGDTWKLIERPSALGIEGGYATLSHRWKSEPFKLTQDTRVAMLNGLADDCLHGTYRDAMLVARSIGLRYIWIDSLCIPQDPGNLDIQIEAYRMAEVYGNSACNISALTAQKDSIFTSRDPLVYSPSATMVPAKVYGLRRSYAIQLVDLWQRSVMTSELAYRGWILQEQLLPRRTLYFGKQQVIWSCRLDGFCETYPPDSETISLFGRGLHQGETAPLRKVLGFALQHFSAASSSSDKDKALTERKEAGKEPDFDWIELLMLYGRRNLTFGSDKLIAIAGLSRLMSSMKLDQLISGLFRKEMPTNLLWTMDHLSARQDVSIPIVKSPVDRAPSWSWAAYDGPICPYRGLGAWRAEGQRIVSQVLNIETTVTTVEDFEVVRGRTLRLCAATLPLIPISNEGDDEEEAPDEESTSPGYWFIPYGASDTRSSTSTDDSTEEPGATLTLGGVFDYYETNEDYEEQGEVLFDLAEYRDLHEPLLAAFISFQISTSVTSDEKRMFRFDGLILRRMSPRVAITVDIGDNTATELYERVGFFAISLLCESDDRPDTPMTTLWNFDEFEMNEEDEATYPVFDFEAAAEFMKVIEIV